MVAGNGIEPRRLALRFATPAIIVEYAYRSAAVQKLYHHEIDLRRELSGTAKLSNLQVDDIVDSIVRHHNAVVGDDKVSPSQLARLVRKLADHRTPAESHSSPPAQVLPQADYNRVSETQLKQVKQKMDLVFEQNIVRPDQAGYQYDKQVEFQSATEASDWDD